MELNNNSEHINNVLRIERQFYEQEQLNADLEYIRPKSGENVKKI